jgi:hypothetical protein
MELPNNIENEIKNDEINSFFENNKNLKTIGKETEYINYINFIYTKNQLVYR